MPTGRAPSTTKQDFFPYFIVVFVLLTRFVTTGPVYFADGPAHVAVILDRTYLLQQPGYWLFNRVAALFPQPDLGITLMNWTFSALGSLFFYYLGRELFSLEIARLGTLVYSVVFFAWFSGNVHSTYATQLFFPVFLFYLLILHDKTGRLSYLLFASVAFAIGTGLRPSDGAFLAPLFCYHLATHSTWRDSALAVSLTCIVCAGWLVPTFHNDQTISDQLLMAASTTSIFYVGLDQRSLANVLRFVVPLAVAFWPFAVLLCRSDLIKDKKFVRYLALWIFPGSIFFLFIYMADAPYLDYLSAAVDLLAMTCAQRASAFNARTSLLACAAWNSVFYLCFVPALPPVIASRSTVAVAALQIYAGKYTRWAVKNQWQPRLSDLIRH